MSKKGKPIEFEKSLDELEKLVARMEQGDLSLEESLQHFERGIALARACQQALAEAEQKVKILISQQGKDALEPFEPEEDQG